MRLSSFESDWTVREKDTDKKSERGGSHMDGDQSKIMNSIEMV